MSLTGLTRFYCILLTKFKKAQFYRDIFYQVNLGAEFKTDIALDELTALTKKRYMNVNLFTENKVINIGLV